MCLYCLYRRTWRTRPKTRGPPSAAASCARSHTSQKTRHTRWGSFGVLLVALSSWVGALGHVTGPAPLCVALLRALKCCKVRAQSLWGSHSTAQQQEQRAHVQQLQHRQQCRRRWLGEHSSQGKQQLLLLQGVGSWLSGFNSGAAASHSASRHRGCSTGACSVAGAFGGAGPRPRLIHAA